MKEDYVSLEVAKQLDKIGFKWFCPNRYLISDGDDGFINYPKPTLYLFHKWLREKKDIHIMIDICASGYYAILFKTNGTYIKTMINKGPNDTGIWNTYEEALNAGIMEALKFI